MKGRKESESAVKIAANEESETVKGRSNNRMGKRTHQMEGDNI